MTKMESSLEPTLKDSLLNGLDRSLLAVQGLIGVREREPCGSLVAFSIHRNCYVKYNPELKIWEDF